MKKVLLAASAALMLASWASAGETSGPKSSEGTLKKIVKDNETSRRRHNQEAAAEGERELMKKNLAEQKRSDVSKDESVTTFSPEDKRDMVYGTGSFKSDNQTSHNTESYGADNYNQNSYQSNGY